MTQLEAWVAFYAGALARAGLNVHDAAKMADDAMNEFKQRATPTTVETDGDRAWKWNRP